MSRRGWASSTGGRAGVPNSGCRATAKARRRTPCRRAVPIRSTTSCATTGTPNPQRRRRDARRPAPRRGFLRLDPVPGEGAARNAGRRQPPRPRQRGGGDRGFGEERARCGAQRGAPHPRTFPEAGLFARSGASQRLDAVDCRSAQCPRRQADGDLAAGCADAVRQAVSGCLRNRGTGATRLRRDRCRGAVSARLSVHSRPNPSARLVPRTRSGGDVMPDGPRHDEDFYAWTQYQAKVLREMAAADNRLDRDNVAEEIEDLGKSERDAVESQIRRILEHFLKLAHSPSDRPRYGWIRSIIEGRATLAQKLSPTLRRQMAAKFAELYQDARELADASLREYGEDAAADALPPACPFTLDQILQRGWYPEGPKCPATLSATARCRRMRAGPMELASRSISSSIARKARNCPIPPATGCRRPG